VHFECLQALQKEKFQREMMLKSFKEILESFAFFENFSFEKMGKLFVLQERKG
jgi:hypothetical protein